MCDPEPARRFGNRFARLQHQLWMPYLRWQRSMGASQRPACAPRSQRPGSWYRPGDDIGAGECVPVAGIAVRESARRDERSLRFFCRPNGMSRLSWEMDPETTALVGELYIRAQSARRGGPDSGRARTGNSPTASLTTPAAQSNSPPMCSPSCCLSSSDRCNTERIQAVVATP